MKKINTPNDIILRVDKAIRFEYGVHIKQSLLEQLIRKKDIMLNNAKCKTSSRVSTKDELKLSEYADSLLRSQEGKKKGNDANKISYKEAKNWIEEHTINQWQDILFLHKPAGLASQGGIGIEISLAKILSAINKGEAINKEQEYRIIHRLDMKVSGIMAIAKGLACAQKISSWFKKRQIKKHYIAVLHGNLNFSELDIRVRFSENLYNHERLILPNQEGKLLSISKIKVLSRNQHFTLACIMPETGIKHQIRAQCSYLGCPIAGDNKYSENPIYKERCQKSQIQDLPQKYRRINRIWLHSLAIKLPNHELVLSKDDNVFSNLTNVLFNHSLSDIPLKYAYLFDEYKN